MTTYEDLGRRLFELGRKLVEHGEAMQGDEAAKALKSAIASVTKLEKIVDATATGNTPEVARLRDLLTHQAGHLTLDDLKKVVKKLGVKVTIGKAAKPAKVRADLLAAAAGGGVADEAYKLIEALVEIGKLPPPDTSDEEAVLRDIRRLGAKEEAAILLELEDRYSDAQVRTLAKVAGLQPTARATKKKLVPELVTTMQRHYENTALHYRA